MSYTRRQAGEKSYLDLYRILEKELSFPNKAIQKKFSGRYPTLSIDNVARYLARIITDCLVSAKIDKDPFFDCMQDLMRIKVLRERSLAKEADKQLKRTRKKASSLEFHIIEYLTYRDELNYLSDTNFKSLDDRVLEETQAQAKSILRRISHIHDHHSLYESINYRVLMHGKITSDDNKSALNDLLLSEMALLAGKNKNTFASQKLHLLFQSSFFVDVGDYHSALKTFRALNNLFEHRLELLDNPPLDYLSALTGIMDCLLALGNLNEMLFFKGKLQQLDNQMFPQHFQYKVKKSVVVYDLAMEVSSGNIGNAEQLIQSFPVEILRSYGTLNEEKQWELYFYCSLVYYLRKNVTKAQAYIREISMQCTASPQLLICKAMRLLDILIYFEKKESHYLEHEIRAYKRFFKRKEDLLQTEVIFLTYIQQSLGPIRRKLPEKLTTKIQGNIEKARSSRYEKQLLKYFDFLGWITARLSK